MTALDLYEILVGEGGIDPTYFLDRMQWWEVQRFIDGMRKRARPQWESTRWLAWLVGKMLGGLKTIDDPQELSTFPWEKELEDPEAMMEANQKLLDELKEQNKAAQEAAHTSGS